MTNQKCANILGNERDNGRAAPWLSNPYSLISWWEMKEFDSSAYFTVGQVLGMFAHMYQNRLNGDEIITLSGEMKATFTTISRQCDDCGLKVSARLLAGLLREVEVAEKLRVTRREMSTKLDQISETIKIEMQQLLFMRIPQEQAEFYNKPELFGKDVNARFPATQSDIVEAGNCYATGRGTAAVFHLMRVMEVGVQQFGTKLTVQLTDQKNWQNILDEVNKAIGKLPPKDPKTVELSHLSSNLYAVKLAWRNEVMHPKETYTLEEAEDLLRQVRIFMQQLAKIV